MSISVGLKDLRLGLDLEVRGVAILRFPLYTLVHQPRPLPLIRVKLLRRRVQLEIEIEDPIELEYLSDLILLIAPL